jgi:hypothetical protein
MAIASALAGATPAKLGAGSEPCLAALVAGAATPLAAFAEAAACRASAPALCAETASQAPIPITKGMRKPAKIANTFHPIPVSVPVWPTEYVLITPPRLDFSGAP